MAARIRKDDIVQVISGEHKGQRGKVLRILHDENRVVIEGVNMVWRHVRKTQQTPHGGRLQREAPVHLSNVMPVNPRSDRPTRVRFKVETDAAGRVVAKQRVATDGTVLGELRKRRDAKGGR